MAIFVGRGVELAALEACFHDREVTAALIVGPAGIGKSRLVQEFTTRLGSEPMVLTGRCLEFGSDGLPYAPFIPVIRALSGSLPQTTDRVRLFGEILTQLETVAATRPLLLILEDLHWADASSRELLAFLVANIDHSIFILGTLREPAPDPVRHLVAELSRSPSVRRVTPPALTRHQVGRQLATLLGHEPDPSLIAKVFQRSQGNPLFVEALSRSPERTPTHLHDILLAGVPHLSAVARELLNVIAVAGDEISHVTLTKVSDVDVAAVRELVTAGLIRASETGYSVRHALIRQALYEDLLPIERTQLHARLAKAVRGNDYQLAAHAFAAGDYPEAVAAAWRAAQQAKSAFADAERLHLLEKVLEHWEHAVGLDRSAVLTEAVEAGLGCGAVERGIELATEALSASPQPRLFYLRGRLKNLGNQGGREDLVAALELLPVEPPTLLRGDVLAELAATNVFLAQQSDAQAAIDVAKRLGERVLAARAYSYLGLGCRDPEEALAHFATAREYGEGDPQTLRAVAVWESAVLIASGRYVQAIESIKRGIAAAHQAWTYDTHGQILVVKWVQALTALGRFEEATQLIEEALADGQPPPLSLAALLISRGEIQWTQGLEAAARESSAAAEPLLGTQRWVRPYRIRLRTLQIRMAPDRSTALRIYDEALAADDLNTHPYEAWPMVVAAAPSEVPDLPVLGPVDEAYKAIATGDRAGAEKLWRQLGKPDNIGRLLSITTASPTPRASTMGLTAREMDVLRLVAEGKSNRQIAQELFISVNTAGVHVSRILTKLGAATRTEAARKFLDANAAA